MPFIKKTAAILFFGAALTACGNGNNENVQPSGQPEPQGTAVTTAGPDGLQPSASPAASAPPEGRAPESSAATAAPATGASAPASPSAPAGTQAPEAAASAPAGTAAPQPEATLSPAAQNSVTAQVMELMIPILDEKSALDPKTSAFIAANDSLFPALTPETKKQAQQLADKKIKVEDIYKDITPYLDKMIETRGVAGRLIKQDSAVGTIARIEFIDESGQYVIGIYANYKGDIKEGDLVTVRGVPSALYSYQNVSGTTTHSLVLAMSTIQRMDL